VDACCVITPDLIGLTGGIESVGTGAEGTVAGAHMLNSTQQMSRSIADVYAVRSDWYEKHRETVEKFVAGYLQATQQVVALRKSFEDTGALDPKYRQVLTMAQSIFGKEVLPTLEVDAHGLLMDCNFVGLPGQSAFFEDRGNLTGFEPMMAKSLDLATGWGYASSRFGFDPPGLDLLKIAKLAGLEYVRPKAGGGRFSSEGIEDFPDSASLDERTIVSFTINFEPNEQQFSADRYGAEFNRAIQTAATFGNAVVVIRGHADPTKTLVEMVRAGQEKGIIKQSGTQGNYSYFLNGKPFDLTQTAQVVRLLQSGAFETKEHQPLRTAQAALNLSVSRAEAVKLSIVEFAKRQGVNLDESQIKPTGAGIAEPLIAKPTNMADARQNMRVDFRIIRVPAEALKESDFDL
jgi:outer membrane protein OmpA-like peptidoglycan-associated protein